MHDDDRDALAAEYVLGTLSASERDQAAALIAADAGFEAAVRRWERRLGELNVMVEAIEPPGRVWETIKTEIASVGPSAPIAPPPPAQEAAQVAPVPPPLPPMPAAPPAIEPAEEPSPVAALAFSLSPSEDKPETDAVTAAADQPPPPPLATELEEPKKIERSADVIYLARRLSRWRRITAMIGAVAAALALYVAAWQFVPDRIPPQLWPAGAEVMARSPAPSRSHQDRLVAVLQQEPTAPAFLVTFDTQNRTLFVRRVSAAPETGRSYELWLISSRLPTPRSLGIVGKEEFTQRAVPANYDVQTLQAASYAVSLEPVGGSPSGVPTGPILFTGRAVESLPASPLPTPNT